MPRPVIRPYKASIELNGSTSELLKDTPTGLNTGTNPLSFVSWIYPKGDGLQVFADLLGGAMGRRFSIGGSAGVYYFFSDGVNAANNMTLTAAQYSAAFRRDARARAVWVVDATEASLYVNGVLIKTQALGISMNSGTYTKLVVGRSAVPSLGFSGWANDAYFANKKMTLADVQADYFEALEPSNMASAWMMGEGAGASIVDRIGSNNLTATSITWSERLPFKKRPNVGGNLVKNGDFEYAPPFVAATNTTSSVWVDGTAAGSASNDVIGWYKITGVGTHAASFDSVVKNSGNYSMKIEATNTTGRGRIMNTPFETSTTPDLIRKYGLPVLRGQDHRLIAYVKSNNMPDSSLKLAVQFFTGQGASISTTNSPFFPATQDFTLYTAIITAPTNAEYARISFEQTVAGNICQAWIDDLSFLPVYPNERDSANGNLLKNPGFEVAPSGGIANTTQSRWPDGTAGGSTTNSTYKWKQQSGVNATAVSFDSVITHGGLYSLKISATDVTGSTYVDIGTGIASSQAVATLRSFGIPVAGGVSYTLKGWVRSNNVPTNGAFLQLTTYDAAGTRLDNVGSSIKLTGTQDWTEITIAQAVHANAVWATIGLMKNVAGNISDAWFDDLRFGKTIVAGSALTAATGWISINDNSLLGGRDATGVFTVTDWTAMSGGNFDLLGMVTLTEGVDFTAETSNEVTASNIADALDIVAGGEFANAVGAVVTVVVGGEDEGGEIVWSGTGVSPTTTVCSGGLDKIKVLVNGAGFTFPDDVAIGVDANASASNLATAINAFGGLDCTALAVANVVQLTSTLSGSAGNATPIVVEGSGGGPIEDDVTISGATLTGGADAVTAVVVRIAAGARTAVT